MGEKRCTCMNGIRYFKGKPVPCTVCEKGKKVGLNNIETTVVTNPLLQWGKTTDGSDTLEVVEEQETVGDLTIDDILKIPQIYRDQHYSRQAINSLIGNEPNALFDKLDELLLNLKQGTLKRGNYFLAAPQYFNVITWAYSMIRTAYQQGFSVIPVSSLDVLYAIYKKDKERSLVRDQADAIEDSGFGVSWLDCMFSELLIVTLPATFSNSDLAFLMTLIDSRNTLNHTTCLLSYWSSKVVSRRQGGNFIFKQGNSGISLFDIYEHFPIKGNNPSSTSTNTKRVASRVNNTGGYHNVVPR